MSSGNLASSGTRYIDSVAWHTSKPVPPTTGALLSENFETGSVKSPLIEYVNSSHYTPNTSEVKYTTAIAQAGNYSANYHALSGTNEHTPLSVECDSACVSGTTGSADGFEEAYFEWYEHFESGYPFCTSAQKIFRIGYDDGNYPEEKKEINFMSLNTNAALQISYACGLWGDSSNCLVDDFQNSISGIETAEWVKIGLWVKLNTSGNSNGFVKMYKNGGLYLDSGQVDLRGTNTKGLNFWWLGGNYSMLSGTLSSSGSRYFDSLVWYPTKPAAPAPNATLLLSENFESGGVGSPLQEVANASHYVPNTSAVKYSTTVTQSGSYSAAYHALSGTNERSPLRVDCGSSCVSSTSGESDGVEETYIEWYEYFESGYPFASSSQDLFRIGYYDGNFPEERKEISLTVTGANAALQIANFCGVWGDSSNCNIDTGTSANTGVPTGQWVKIGVWVKLNSPGQSDGFVKVFQDGSLLLNSPNVDVRGSNTKGLNYWWVGGGYSMASGNLSASGTRYFDSVAWYTSKPTM